MQLPATVPVPLTLLGAPTRRLQVACGAFCLAMVAAVGWSDYLTGYDLSLSILYLAPVLLATWVLGSVAGIVFSIVSLAAWLISVHFMGHPYTDPFNRFWDAAVHFMTWVGFSLILVQLKVALARADERFVTVLEEMDAAVYVSDIDTGELLYVNDAFRKAFGAGMPGRRPDVLAGEFHDAASRRWYLVRARAIRWTDGRMVRLHIAADITESKETQEFNRQQQEKLQMTARLITVGEMASTLAHEINQPLAAIANYNSGCVRRLRSGDWDATELIEAMEKTSEQTERAGRIIRRVREFVRKRDPAFVACDVNEIIAGVANMVEIAAEKHETKVELDLAPAIPMARADRVMIEQVVLNLVRNAIESMRDTAPESRKLTVRTAEGATGGIEIEVADNGCGLPAQLDGNLFTPFFTTKPEGMGMGLNICRSIVEMHDGRLWASRRPEGGSSFHFTLPVA
jgi:C4-dicarboxylate-specific signal transduction histidine kinase